MSMSFPGCFGPEINMDNIMNFLFMHNHGGKLYIIITTDHVLCELLCIPCRFIPLVDKARRRFLGSFPG